MAVMRKRVETKSESMLARRGDWRQRDDGMRVMRLVKASALILEHKTNLQGGRAKGFLREMYKRELEA